MEYITTHFGCQPVVKKILEATVQWQVRIAMALGSDGVGTDERAQCMNSYSIIIIDVDRK